MDTQRKSKVVAGLALISIGIVLFWLQRVQDLGSSAILVVIGSLFLAAYFYGRNFGFLIPGCLLLGLGAGSLMRNMASTADARQIGLGAGFVAIFLIGAMYERKARWWPLIPGAVLLISAFSFGARVMQFLRSGGWPLLLVIVGVVILLGALGGGGGGKRSRKGAM